MRSSSSPTAAGPRYEVGTLSYTQEQLYVLFFWLMWNDFTIMLLEQPVGFARLLQIDHGATNTQVGIFGTIAGLTTIWITPVFSVWSDRTRTRWGRRRPFLLVAAPMVAFFIAVTPYMPSLTHYLLRYPWAASLFQSLPMKMNGTVFMLGLCIIMTQVFNQVVMALYGYFFWDVVPKNVLGRWTSLCRILGASGGFIWSFFLIGMADHHMKALCVGIASFSLVIYLLSVWQVREGDYPPVDKHRKGGVIAPVRAYFVECFSDPFYLWVFGAFLVCSTAGGASGYIMNYLRYDLHMSYDTIGKWGAVPPLISIPLGFLFWKSADRLHPVKVFAPTFFAWGLICIGSFFFVRSPFSYFCWSMLTQVAVFANGVTYGALLPRIYPREKFGQFCSANALCGYAGGILVSVPLGYLFDRLHSYRYAYLLQAFFLIAGAALFLKVHREYDKRHGQVPVPHAG